MKERNESQMPCHTFHNAHYFHYFHIIIYLQHIIKYFLLDLEHGHEADGETYGKPAEEEATDGEVTNDEPTGGKSAEEVMDGEAGGKAGGEAGGEVDGEADGEAGGEAGGGVLAGEKSTVSGEARVGSPHLYLIVKLSVCMCVRASLTYNNIFIKIKYDFFIVAEGFFNFIRYLFNLFLSVLLHLAILTSSSQIIFKARYIVYYYIYCITNNYYKKFINFFLYVESINIVSS